MTILQTEFGHAQIGVTEINDPATWSSFWQQNCSVCVIKITTGAIIISPTPQIDFKTHTVLVASLRLGREPRIQVQHKPGN